MGISASIMIMINVVSWPHILEKIRKEPPLARIKDHRGRAKQFLSQIDEIVEFCSGLMDQIKDLAGESEDGPPVRDDDEQDEAHRQHMATMLELWSNSKENNRFNERLVGGICHITDKCKVTIVECNMRRKNPFVKDDYRLEGDEEGTSKLEEIVVFEQNAYVMMNGEEYVFREGAVFAEKKGDKTKDKNVRCFALVTPSTKSPCVLRLTPNFKGPDEKLALSKD